MLQKKRCKKIIALGVSCALMLTSLVGSLWSASAIDLTATGRVTDAEIVFEPSTVSTGSLGWKENGGLNDLIVPDGYGRGENGLFALSPAGGNQGWLPMYVYDAESESLQMSKTVLGNFMTAFKVDTCTVAVTAVTGFSGRLYSPSFKTDQPNAAIVINYIDNGNFDLVYPYTEAGNVYFRTWAVRTETLQQGAIAYKNIYGSTDRLGQHQANGFVPGNTVVAGETLEYMDFRVAYTSVGTTVTVTSDTAEVSYTFANDYFLTQQVDNILTGTADRRTISTFGDTPLSAVKSVGFAAKIGTSLAYADDVSVEYTYTKNAEQLAQDFKAAHSEILSKETVQDSDAALVEAALEDYNTLVAAVPGLAAALAAEKTKLDGFLATISGDLAAAWLEAHAAATALTTDTASKNNLGLIKAAQAAYNRLGNSVQAEIVHRFNTAHATDYTDMNVFLNMLANAVYYDKNGVLVYDDFSGANAAAWEEITVGDRTFISPRQAVKPLGRLVSVTWNYTIVPKNLASGLNPIVLYADETNYIMPRFAYEPSWDETFFNDGSVTPGVYRNWYYGSHSRSGAIGENPTMDVSFIVTYDYAAFDGEPSQIHPNFPYAAKHIDVTLASHYQQINATATQNQIAVILGNEQAPAVPQELFSVGYYDTNDNMRLNSVEFAYAKAAEETSEAFEAYADTYSMGTSTVTKDNAVAIDAALAVYDGLTAVQKNAYKAEYNNLVDLKTVADFHAAVAGYTVTPASAAQIEAYQSEWAAMQITNTTIDSSVAALDTALDVFRPTMYSATIKVTGVPEEQDLRFKSKMAVNAYSRSIVRYGTVMLPNQLLVGDTELTLETDIPGYPIVNASTVVSGGDTLPAVFYGNLGGSAYTANRCGIRIASRAYIVYNIEGTEYTLYSTNSNSEGDRAQAIGVEDGHCVRSVNLIARRMAKVVIETAGTYGAVTYTEHITSATASAEIDMVEATHVLEFTAKNKAIIERYSQSQQ